MKRQILAIAICWLAICLLFQLQFFRDSENGWSDLKTRLFARRIDPDVVLVEIDQRSLDFYSREFHLSWPWPRSLYARAVKFLSKAGSRLIVLDMVFSEPSAYAEEDQQLADAMAAAGNVFLPFFLNQDRNAAGDIERFALSGRVSYTGFAAQGVTPAAEPLLNAQKGGGNASLDKAEIYRCIPQLFSYRGRSYPSFALAMARFMGRAVDLDRILDSRGRLYLRFYRPGSFVLNRHRFSISQIIQSQMQIEEKKEPEVSPSIFKGKAVIIGATAFGLLDQRPTPLDRGASGFEIWATNLENFLRNEYVRVWPAAWQWPLILLLVAFVTVLLNRLRIKAWYWQIALALLLSAVVLVINFAVFGIWFWQLWTVPMLLSVLLPAGYDVYYRNHLLRREKKRIQTAFELHLSESLVRLILKHPEALKLGGEKKTLTIFFSDLAGFTSMSERLTPEEVVDLLNAYLERMTEIITAHDGYVDKFEGDAIMAFWGAPLPIADPATKAMHSALSCQRELARLNETFSARGLPALQMRVGINSGEVVVGNIGSQKKINYTVIGDAVNLASRLEGVNKQYGTRVVCGTLSRELDMGRTVLRRLDRVRVKGKARPEEIFEVVGEKEAVSQAVLAAVAQFEKGLELYFKGDFSGAAAAFAEMPEDPPSRVFRKRCRYLGENPPAEWDGVWTFTEK